MMHGSRDRIMTRHAPLPPVDGGRLAEEAVNREVNRDSNIGGYQCERISRQYNVINISIDFMWISTQAAVC